MNHLLIFARHPELGRVKTRLARTLGDAAALTTYVELLGRTRAAAEGLSEAHKTVWFADHAPAAAEAETHWAGYDCRVQPAGDLGQRMATGFGEAFAAGATAAVVIGTDCPELSTAHLAAAFTHLHDHDLVLGPADDGGYYLLGLRQAHAELFANKEWSTAAVLPATLADARRLGLRVALLPTLRDVDTEDDLRAWRQNSAH